MAISISEDTLKLILYPKRMLERAKTDGVCVVAFDDVEEAKKFYRSLAAFNRLRSTASWNVFIRRDANVVLAATDTKYMPGCAILDVAKNK